MRSGFKVYDADTHVMPLAEVLEQYVDPSFRPRLLELAPYRVPAGKTADSEGQLHRYSVQRRFYRRTLGEADPHPTFTDRGGTWRGTKAPVLGCRTISLRTVSRTWMTRALAYGHLRMRLWLAAVLGQTHG
jgi:hypothetical protein